MITGRFYYDAYGTIGIGSQENTNYNRRPRCLELAGKIRGKNDEILEITSCIKENQQTVISHLKRVIAEKSTEDFPKEDFAFQSSNLLNTQSYMPAIQYFDPHKTTEITSLKSLHFYLNKMRDVPEHQKQATIAFFLAFYPEFEKVHIPILHL